MPIEKKIAIYCTLMVALIIVLGAIDPKPQILSQDEFWKNCHLTDTC
jgi:hypothetical protein